MISSLEQIKKKVSPSFVKYLITGVVSLAADYGSFLILFYVFNVSLQSSILVGLISGFVLNFCMNKFWSFKSKKSVKHKPFIQFILYSLLFGFNYLFTYYFIHFLEKNGIQPFIGKILATGCITIWNYFTYKLAIFKENIDIPVVIE